MPLQEPFRPFFPIIKHLPLTELFVLDKRRQECSWEEQGHWLGARTHSLRPGCLPIFKAFCQYLKTVTPGNSLWTQKRDGSVKAKFFHCVLLFILLHNHKWAVYSGHCFLITKAITGSGLKPSAKGNSELGFSISGGTCQHSSHSGGGAIPALCRKIMWSQKKNEMCLKHFLKYNSSAENMCTLF